MFDQLNNNNIIVLFSGVTKILILKKKDKQEVLFLPTNYMNLIGFGRFLSWHLSDTRLNIWRFHFFNV